jgi:hypothetical protein
MFALPRLSARQARGPARSERERARSRCGRCRAQPGLKQPLQPSVYSSNVYSRASTAERLQQSVYSRASTADRLQQRVYSRSSTAERLQQIVYSRSSTADRLQQIVYSRSSTAACLAERLQPPLPQGVYSRASTAASTAERLQPSVYGGTLAGFSGRLWGTLSMAGTSPREYSKSTNRFHTTSACGDAPEGRAADINQGRVGPQ